MDIEPILAQERANTKVDPLLLRNVLYAQSGKIIRSGLDQFERTVDLDANIYNQGRIHMIKDTIQKLPNLVSIVDPKVPGTLTAGVIYMQNQFPGSVHMTMWMICLDLMASQAQKAFYYDKSMKGEIIGCYAQTQLGHGSDVQSLETTATLDKSTDTFVINTPSVSATKFWPGDLGIFATHAAVYARVMVDGNSLGVFPIIVQIRDDNHKPMPGVECGDIGPKVGYITKDNGYLSFRNVRVPRTNLMSKLIDITPEGQIQMKGDPKVLYASMMLTRKLIITVFPKLYSNGLTIATRYSFYRKMFKDDRGHEITIAEYQTHQEKLLPLIADYYAFSIDGNKISDLTDDNFKRVTEGNDASLMAECHASLCYSKAYYTDWIQIGMDILRRACGGHGYSHYSGMPNLVQEFYAHPVHEGQNTVLYLQVSRYIVKNYKKLVEKGDKSKLQDSVRYLKDYETFKNYRITLQPSNTSLWTADELLKIFGHVICSNLSIVVERQQQFKELGSKNTQNTKNGLMLVDLAKSHSLFNTFKSFWDATLTLKHEASRLVLSNLCLLYGIHHILLNPLTLIESGCLQPSHISSLKDRKEQLLKELRPNLIGLVDAFIISEKGLKSALTQGNVYKNMLQLAKKNAINREMSPSIWTLKEGLTNTRPRL